jgi:hypothetical protein
LVWLYESRLLFRKPPLILKIVRKPAMKVHRKKSTKENEGKPEQKFDVAFGTIF